MNQQSAATQSRPRPDAELVRVLDDYLAALQSGTAPAKAEVLAKYPELADDLEGCLASLEFIARAAADSQLGTEGAEFSGKPLGDYRILREIGRGGMGVVYEAEQLSLGRRVALKVLPFAAVLDPRHLQRFKNEAQAAAGLHHTNIVPVYSVGCQRGVHYYAMQYIEGQTLADVIGQLRQLARAGNQGPGAGDQGAGVATSVATPSGGARDEEREERVTGRRGDNVTTAPATDSPPHPLTPSPPHVAETSPLAALSTERSTRDPEFFRAVARLGIQAAEALEHAHGMGVVHRDIKPSNLMVELSSRSHLAPRDGWPHAEREEYDSPARGRAAGAECPHLWITDFGLAMTQTDTNLTMTGDLLGTLRYMSPEQVEARHGVLDHRTDVYSLGVTLYELLTLQPAFPGDDRQKLIRQVIEDDPCPPRQLDKRIPKDLETILLKATAKEPHSRYATAQDLADDLRRFQEDKPIRARRPSLAERTARWSRRHQTIVWAALVILLIAVAALSVSTLLITRAYNLAEKERLRAEENAKALGEGWMSAIGSMSEAGGDFTKIIAVWNDVIRRNPESAACYRGRGYVYVHYGFMDEAIADLSKAIQLKPKDPIPYNWRAWAYLEQGKVDAAIDDCTQAIRLYPKNAAAYAGRGYLYWHKGNLRQAMADYNKSIQIEPRYTLAYCWRALAHAGLGQRDEALSDLDKVSDMHPPDFVHVSIVSWFLATGPDPELHRPDRAVELAEEAVRLRPMVGHLWLILGAAQYRKGNFAEARKSLDRSNELPMSSNRHAMAWLFLAMTHWQLGNKQEARGWYNKAVEWMDNNPQRREEFDRFRAEAASLLGVVETTPMK